MSIQIKNAVYIDADKTIVDFDIYNEDIQQWLPYTFKMNEDNGMIHWDETQVKSVLTTLDIADPDITEILAAAKTAKKAELTAGFNSTLVAGYTCPTSSIKMNATLDDIQKLQDGYNLETDLGSTDMTVRDYNNDYHDMALTDVKTMLTELGENYKAQLANLWALKDKVTAATTTDDVTAISWTAATIDSSTTSTTS